MKIFNVFMVLCLSTSLAFGTTPVLQTIDPVAKTMILLAASPKLMVVKFHADWCGSCRALGPAITDLSNKLDGQAVLFTELDFTNITAKNQTLLLAGALGIEEVVKNNNGTGFILIIDGATKKVLAKLDKTQSVKEMSKIISNLL